MGHFRHDDIVDAFLSVVAFFACVPPTDDRTSGIDVPLRPAAPVDASPPKETKRG
jgi:hypothetical protein